MTTFYHMTKVSSNAKTGPIPVTTTSENSCPDSCPLKKNGCYAEDYYLSMHWKKVSSGERGNGLDVITDNIKAFPVGQVWRHNQAGDLPKNPRFKNVIDSRSVFSLTIANREKRGFTYTHHDMSLKTNRKIVAAANRDGFTINLSANNASHADELYNLGVGPVVAVLPIDTPKLSYTPGGVPVVVCPALNSEKVKCSNCALCQKSDREYIIGFPAHGSRKNAAIIATSNN